MKSSVVQFPEQRVVDRTPPPRDAATLVYTCLMVIPLTVAALLLAVIAAALSIASRR